MQPVLLSAAAVFNINASNKTLCSYSFNNYVMQLITTI